MLDRAQVLHVARLARLELTDEEVDRMAAELSKVLDHIEKIRELDLEGVPPTSHVVDVVNALRADEPQPSLPVEVALESAPEPIAGGFGVPSPGYQPTHRLISRGLLVPLRIGGRLFFKSEDLPKIAAALTDRYDRLILAVADRLSVHEFLRQELTGAFTAYLDYLLLASEGGFDMRTTTPLFLCSAGYEPPVEGARTIVLDIGHDDLLRAPRVHELVTDLLTGEHPW